MSFEIDPSQFSREWIDLTNWDDQEVIELLCIEVTTPIGDSTLGKDTYQSERAWSDYEIHSLGNLEKLPREILNMIEPRHSRWVCSIIPAYERARNVRRNNNTSNSVVSRSGVIFRSFRCSPVSSWKNSSQIAKHPTHQCSMTSILPRGTTLALIVKDFEEHGHDEEKM